MLNRLIQLVKNAHSRSLKIAFESDENRKTIDELVAFDLIANGVIAPNVKIGDKLYAINAAFNRVHEYYVTHLEVYDCGVKIFGRQLFCREEQWLCWDADLRHDENRVVFLTREEAEKALAERKEL